MALIISLDEAISMTNALDSEEAFQEAIRIHAESAERLLTRVEKAVDDAKRGKILTIYTWQRLWRAHSRIDAHLVATAWIYRSIDAKLRAIWPDVVDCSGPTRIQTVADRGAW